MDKLTPEVIEKLLGVIPLAGLGLALLIIAFLLLIVAVLSLWPWAYREEEGKPQNRIRVLTTLIIGAAVFGGLGWLTLEALNSYLLDTAHLMSNVEVNNTFVAPEPEQP